VNETNGLRKILGAERAPDGFDATAAGMARMKKLTVFLLVLFSAVLAYGQQEAQGKAEPQVQAVEQFLDRAIGVLRTTTESTSALSTCGVSRGQITFGVPINSSFGDCFIAGTYIDFWAFTAQAGQTVRVTFSSTPSVLVTIQDYTTGTVLADSQAACGGGLCTSASFTYTPLSSVQYLVGLGSFALGNYTFTVDSAGSPPSGANLTPYKVSGWSDKIVVSKVTGDHIDAASISTSDTLYVDYAVANVGTASTGVGFTNLLYLDGVLIRTGNASALDVNFYTFASDVIITPRTAGTHTLRLKTDSAGVIAETNELDNEYTRTFTVAGASPCVFGAATLCLNSSRFKVSVAWQSPTASGNGTAISMTSDTGYFWFFDSNNVELVVKVLDGRTVNNHFWVFAAGMTNVHTVLTVTDTQTGAVKVYTNPQGTAFQPVQDTLAF
jgi:hypothetical protein